MGAKKKEKRKKKKVKSKKEKRLQDYGNNGQIAVVQLPVVYC